ncbi:MAG: polyprenyl synthetase family protein [Candidatus Hecatellaceae archaeon]
MQTDDRFKSETWCSDEEFLRSVQNYIDLINSKLEEVTVNYPTFLELPLRYVIKAGGKRLRPLLALLSCLAVCGDPKPAIPVAVAYEFAHTAALIQDDIIDKGIRRRGKLSAWALWGTEKAVLISDILIFEIFHRLAEYERLSLPQERLYLLLRLIGDSARRTVQGEFLELELSGKEKVTEEDYLTIIRLKTGALLAASAAAGAIAGGGSTSEVSAIHEFAEKIGMAYQIYDDILDVSGNPERLGKPVFVDIRNRKRNLLVIYALNNGSEEESKFIRSLLGKRKLEEWEFEKAKEIFEKTGSVDAAKKLSFKFAEEGRSCLKALKPSQAKDQLIELSYLVSKRYA